MGLSEVAMMPSVRLALLTVVGTVGCVGLAILGFGGFNAFFSRPARLALAVAVFIMSGVAVFGGGNLSPDEREEDSIRWLGVVLFVAGGALRIWPVFVLGGRFSGLVAIQPGHT